MLDLTPDQAQAFRHNFPDTHPPTTLERNCFEVGAARVVSARNPGYILDLALVGRYI